MFVKLAAALTAAATVVGGLLLTANPAGAALTPTPGYFPGYGFDNTPHIIVGGGSDTTYRAQTGLGDLWSESGLSGCQHNTTAGPSLGNCNVQAIDATNRGNWDGDTIGQANPYGSSTGFSSLNGSPAGGQASVSYPAPRTLRPRT